MVADPTTFDSAGQQAMFFRNPAEEPQIPGFFGSLYLLRRDLNDMRRVIPDAALWPRAMAVFAGIDLLAKFFTNKDDIGGVADRYTRFVARFITQDNNQALSETEAIWQCRNSLLHSFGWWARGRSVTYRFALARDTQTWLTRQDNVDHERWFVNLTELEQRFENSITEYQRLILDPHEPESFPTGNQIFERYGWMAIG